MNTQNTISIRKEIKEIGYNLKLIYIELYIKYNSKSYKEKLYNLIKNNQIKIIKIIDISNDYSYPKMHIYLKREKDLLNLIKYIKYNKNLKDKVYKYYICYNINKNGRKNKNFN